MVNEEEKYCRSCDRNLPLSKFGFRKVRGVYRPTCKKCASKKAMETPRHIRNERNNRFIEANPTFGPDSWKNAPEGELRFCKTCKEELPIKPEYWQRDAKAKWGLRPTACKICLKSRQCYKCKVLFPIKQMNYLRTKKAHVCNNCI